MKNYLIGLVILLLSSCSSPKTTIAENEFEVSNKGIEMFLSATPIKLPQSLQWTIDVNFSKNKSEVVELVEGVDQLDFI